MNSLKAQGTKAFIWDFFGKMATHGMGFIVSIFLARLLEPSDFGLIAMVMVIIGIANIFTDLGLGVALIQRRRVHHLHYASVFYFNTFVGVLLTVISYFSATLISDFYENKQLINIVQAMSFSFIIGAFSSVQSTKLRKEVNFALLTKIGFTSSAISGVLGIVLAFLGAGVWSLVVQVLVGGVLYNILIWTNVKWFPGLEFSWKALRQLWGFGFRIFIATAIDSVTVRLDFMIIGKIYDAVTLGFFQRAKSLNSLVIEYSSGSLMAVLFPLLSQIQNDLLRFQRIILSSLGVIVFSVFLLLGNFYLISEELIVLLFSDKWLPSVEYFRILILSGFGYPISVLLVNVLMSRGKSKDFLRLTIYKKVIFVLNLYIGFLFGIEGYLYGLIVVAITGVTLNAIYVSKEITLPFWLLIRPMLLQACLTIIIVFLTYGITLNVELSAILLLIVKIIIFSLLYFIFNYILKTSSYMYFVEYAISMIQLFKSKS